MPEDLTRRSLLLRVRDASDTAAWAEFESRYRDLIIRYARARGLQPADADDVCQSVLTRLCRTMRDFAYEPGKGRFRTYLHRAVQNEIIDQFARPKCARNTVAAIDAESLALDEGGADSHWEREWENHHIRLALQSIRRTFDAESVAVFERLLAGESVESISETTELTSQAIHKIKQRIRNRMQELIARQIAEEDDPEAQPGD